MPFYSKTFLRTIGIFAKNDNYNNFHIKKKTPSRTLVAPDDTSSSAKLPFLPRSTSRRQCALAASSDRTVSACRLPPSASLVRVVSCAKANCSGGSRLRM